MVSLRRAVTVVMPVLVLFCLITVEAADAHPLGNFSVNHHDGLRLSQDRIDDTAVVDSAEIPTAQDEDTTDTDHDGTISPAEAADRATERCAELARRTTVSVGGEQLTWRVRHSALTYGKGAAGLAVARLTCALRADAGLSRPADVTFASGADAARTGWKEITAVAGNGVRLARSSAPAKSPSQVLRHYPADRAGQPLGVVTARFRTEPGANGTAAAAGAPKDTDAPRAQAVDRGAVLFPALENRLTTLTAGRDLTLPVGLLAVVLSLLLGAGHAALPGHAKLVVAACLARRQGGVRAALAVGATVTVTHTAGVLAMGLLLTAGGGFLGERLLGWLGAVSGTVIMVLGAVLTVTALRALRSGRPVAYLHHGHGHGHGHDHGHGLGHGHDHGHGRRERANAHTHAASHTHVFAHAHGPTHGSHAYEGPSRHEGDSGTSGSDTAPSPVPAPAPSDLTKKTPRRIGFPALLGVGLAGGLVPSPSALVVLLGAVALSRTLFGVLLVLGYGLGMALTLTTAGLVLSGGGSRLAALGERRLPNVRRYAPYGTVLTALAVLTVGIGLTLRSLL